MLISRAIKEYYPQKNKTTRVVWVLALAIAYAFSDEFHQGFVPNRTVSLFDIMVDSIGSVAGCLMYR
jgi:VanZ family protein